MLINVKYQFLVFGLFIIQIFMLSSAGTPWATGDYGTVGRNRS